MTHIANAHTHTHTVLEPVKYNTFHLHTGDFCSPCVVTVNVGQQTAAHTDTEQIQDANAPQREALSLMMLEPNR